MTHTIPNIFNVGEKTIQVATHPLYIQSDVKVEYNFGLFKVSKIAHNDSNQNIPQNYQK
jgi:hypothetical protein